MEAKEKEAKDNYDNYLRAVAELDNYRKRAAREKADIIKYGKEDLMKDILPFLDSLDRALEHADSNDVQAFKDRNCSDSGSAFVLLEKTWRGKNRNRRYGF